MLVGNCFGLEFGDGLDTNGYMYIAPDDDFYTDLIDRKDAIKIANHLAKHFDLTIEDFDL